jgi:hypothetical protein
MQCRFLTREEFRAADDARLALAKKRGEDAEWLKANNATYGWARLDEITGPGIMWSVPWYFDPENPEHKLRRERALEAIKDGSFGTGERNYYLSRFYWERWSHVRSPISVLCPNGVEWCIDAKSSNGEGWEVTGEAPAITARPSILVPGYHGWLTEGVFSPNI